MDPQQRLLLRAAWEAIEDAGIVVDPHRKYPAGVFVGISTTDYANLQIIRTDLPEGFRYQWAGECRDLRESGQDILPFHVPTGPDDPAFGKRAADLDKSLVRMKPSRS
jgi:hypothetical protein